MARKRKCQRRDDSSSSDASSYDDEMPSAATTPIRITSESLAATEKQRKTRRREDKGIKQMLEELKEDFTSEMRKQLKILGETKDDIREIRKQLKKFTESHNELRKYLVHINGSSGDDSATPRSEWNQVQPPRYRLEFTCEVNDEIEKGQIIETKKHGKTISVALYDDHNQIVETEPLASATVMLVVVNAEFNQHGNQYNWLRKDFERNIKRPRKGNPAMGDVNQPIESIVSNCVFKLDGGVKSHTGATILYNSSNKKVRLGVMVLSPAEERVLEGLSNPFFVRGHDRPARQSNLHYNGSKRQKQVLVGYGYQERNGPMFNMENTSCPNLTQPREINGNVSYSLSGFDTVAAPNTIMLPTEPSISPELQASIMQDQFSHPTMYGASMAQAPNNLAGTQFNMDQIARPVQLVWDRPNVELRKSWNLLDQLMPLYSCPPRFYNSGLPTVHPMTEHLGSLASMLKGVMQATRRKKGVLIEPIEPDDSDEKRPLKRKLHSKYRLRFVNKVCKAYYTWDKIKASDGDLLKVALFDENNMRITSGPLSSAFVEVVVLHGDFNVDGQHYWTSEEFSGCVVCPKAQAGKEAPVLRGNRVLALVDGEACLCDAFFQITSCHARTGKFKMGVVLASAQDERIQEGISEPFRVRERPWKDLPPGFRFRPTDEELILHYLRNRVAALPCPVRVIPEVDISKFNPWELIPQVDISKFNPWELIPRKAVYRIYPWYFFSPWDPNGIYHAAGSGHWKATGTGMPITSGPSHRELGFKTAFVFYRGGCVPTSIKTDWIMYVYRLDCDLYNSSNKDSRPTSSTKRDEWVLCKICNKQEKQQLSKSIDDDDLGQPVQYQSSSCTDLPPGFRFHPTDQELILHYLRNRAASQPCPVPIIADVDRCNFEPRDLPCKAVYGVAMAGKAVYGDGDWYFFVLPDSKYETGMRRNHTTRSGYWKSTGTNRPIHDTATGDSIGFKKTLVFYKGRPPSGSKTEWIMHEYRLADTDRICLEDWVLCRIFYKKTVKDDHSVVSKDNRRFQWMPNYPSSMSDHLELRMATAEPSEKLPVKTAASCLYPATEDSSVSYVQQAAVRMEL